MPRPAPSRALLVALLAAACSGGGGAVSPPAGTSPADPTPPPTAATSPPAATAPATASPAPTSAAPTSATPAPTASRPAASTPVPATSASPATPATLAWAALEPEGERPGAREDHTWTVDGGGRIAYLFGGRSGSTTFDDLWAYDLAFDRWTRLDPPGARPSARLGHGAVWVDGQGLVVWAGQAGPDFFDDLWAYDPATGGWRELPNGGAVPPARYGSCSALGPDGRLWISHGFTSEAGRFSDTRAYDFAQGAWTDLTPDDRPVVRCLHDCLWGPDGRFLLYGGQTNGAPALGDLWALTPAADGPGRWQQLRPDPQPAARQLYALAAIGDRAHVFGGGDAQRRKLDDLWTLDLRSAVWSETRPAGEGPSGRSGAALVSDPGRGRLVLFGGRTEEGELDDLYALTLDAG